MKSLITVAIEDTYLNRIKTIYVKLRGDRSSILYSEKLKVFFHKVKNKKRMLTLSSSINIVLGGLATIIKQNKKKRKSS